MMWVGLIRSIGGLNRKRLISSKEEEIQPAASLHHLNCISSSLGLQLDDLHCRFWTCQASTIVWANFLKYVSVSLSIYICISYWFCFSGELWLIQFPSPTHFQFASHFKSTIEATNKTESHFSSLKHSQRIRITVIWVNGRTPFSVVEHISLYDLRTHPSHPSNQLKRIRFCKWYCNKELGNLSSLLSTPLLTSLIDFGQVKSFSLL